MCGLNSSATGSIATLSTDQASSSDVFTAMSRTLRLDDRDNVVNVFCARVRHEAAQEMRDGPLAPLDYLDKLVCAIPVSSINVFWKNHRGS